MIRRFFSWYFKHPGTTASVGRRAVYAARIVLTGMAALAGILILLFLTTDWLYQNTDVRGDKESLGSALIGMGFAAIAVIIGFPLLIRNLWKMQHADNTPTSKIDSAAQGYVELSGTIMVPPDTGLLHSPHGNVPCVWWEYVIKDYPRGKQTDRSWVKAGKEQSTDVLYLMDGSGICEIHPQGASIVTEHQCLERKTGGVHSIERLLLPGRKLYALGDFRTRDQRHVLQAPADGRPFLLSGKGETDAIASVRLRAGCGLALFIGGTLWILVTVWRLWA